MFYSPISYNKPKQWILALHMPLYFNFKRFMENRQMYYNLSIEILSSMCYYFIDKI